MPSHLSRLRRTAALLILDALDLLLDGTCGKVEADDPPAARADGQAS